MSGWTDTATVCPNCGEAYDPDDITVASEHTYLACEPARDYYTSLSWLH